MNVHTYACLNIYKSIHIKHLKLPWSQHNQPSYTYTCMNVHTYRHISVSLYHLDNRVNKSGELLHICIYTNIYINIYIYKFLFLNIYIDLHENILYIYIYTYIYIYRKPCVEIDDIKLPKEWLSNAYIGIVVNYCCMCK
jgi:hypothetical protein